MAVVRASGFCQHWHDLTALKESKVVYKKSRRTARPLKLITPEFQRDAQGSIMYDNVHAEKAETDEPPCSPREPNRLPNRLPILMPTTKANKINIKDFPMTKLITTRRASALLKQHEAAFGEQLKVRANISLSNKVDFKDFPMTKLTPARRASALLKQHEAAFDEQLTKSGPTSCSHQQSTTQ